MLGSIPKQCSADTPSMYPLVAMTDFQIQELSWVIAAMVTGIVLWATGGWILRPAVGALGVALGALLGWTVWQETGIGPAWIPPLVGGIVVACVALLAYRLLAGAMLAASLALLVGLGAWTVLSLSQEDMPHPPIVHMLGLADTAAADGPAPEPPTTLDTTIAPVALPSAALPATTDWLDSEELTPFRLAWSTVPSDPRLVIMIAAAAGALVGLVLATFATTFGAVLLTACCGALLMLAAGPRLLDLAGLSPGWLKSGAAGTGLVIGWIGLTVIGLIVQSLARPRLTAKPTPPAGSG